MAFRPEIEMDLPESMMFKIRKKKDISEVNDDSESP